MRAHIIIRRIDEIVMFGEGMPDHVLQSLTDLSNEIEIDAEERFISAENVMS